MLAAATHHDAAVGHAAVYRHLDDHLSPLGHPPIPRGAPIRPVATIFSASPVIAPRLKPEPLRCHVLSRYK